MVQKGQKLDDREAATEAYAIEVYEKQFEAGELEKLGEWQTLTEGFMEKAADYVANIPGTASPTGSIVKGATIQLRRPYTPSMDLEQEVAVQLINRYTDAAATFLKDLDRKPTISKDQIKEILVKGNGNFLYLHAALVDQGHLDLGNVEHVCIVPYTHFRLLLTLISSLDWAKSSMARSQRSKRPPPQPWPGKTPWRARSPGQLVCHERTVSAHSIYCNAHF